MKVFICLTIFLFTSVQFRTEEIAVYDREKFICAASSEKIEDKTIAWVGFRARDFAIPIFGIGKQTFRILDLLLNGGFLRFINWCILPRKPPNASFYVKKGLR